jgi:surface polysaccharide O-acyltransferase-like enzyme
VSKVVKERLPQLDIFRALAIFSVIQVHASSFAAAEQALNSPVYYFYNWMNIFFKIGTPSFILLSSLVLF